MTSTIQSIANNAQEAAKVASTAVDAARTANASAAKLGKSSAEIGEGSPFDGHPWPPADRQPGFSRPFKQAGTVSSRLGWGD
jgi:hypothetical protein